jgi:DNA anti-recombination protein RmuC
MNQEDREMMIDIVQRLARIEEHCKSIDEHMKTVNDEMGEVFDRLDKVEKSSAGINAVYKVLIAISTTGIALIAVSLALKLFGIGS